MYPGCALAASEESGAVQSVSDDGRARALRARRITAGTNPKKLGVLGSARHIDRRECNQDHNGQGTETVILYPPAG
jgi:hypothetical protein